MTNGPGESVFRSIGSKDRLVDRVVGEIQRLILDGELKPGTKLPPEREFADQIGVSRTVLREAVHILVTKGLLETRHGIGTVVRGASPDHLAEPLSIMLQTSGISLDHLHQVRSILEVAIVELAATQVTDRDCAELEQIMAEMEAHVGDTEASIRDDDQFHQTLAKTAHNPLLVVLVDSIRDLLLEVRLKVHRAPHIYSMILPDHRRILDMIKARDPAGARLAMQAHLEHARELQFVQLASEDYPQVTGQEAS